MELRAFTADDTEALAAWFADEASLVQWGGPAVVFPLDRSQIASFLREAAANPPTRWLFRGVAQGVMVAHAQCALDWRHGVARLARVGVNPACRGRGLATPFLRLILQRIFAVSGFERVELNVYSFNTAAIRTYERLGFVQEGVRRFIGPRGRGTLGYSDVRAAQKPVGRRCHQSARPSSAVAASRMMFSARGAPAN